MHSLLTNSKIQYHENKYLNIPRQQSQRIVKNNREKHWHMSISYLTCTSQLKTATGLQVFDEGLASSSKFFKAFYYLLITLSD